MNANSIKEGLEITLHADRSTGISSGVFMSSASSTRPVRSALMKAKMGESQISLSTGLHLAHAPAGGGKSLLCASIVSLMTRAKEKGVTSHNGIIIRPNATFNVGFLYAYEDGSPTYRERSSISVATTEGEATDKADAAPYFSDPQSFHVDVFDYLSVAVQDARMDVDPKDTSLITSSGYPVLVVIDSVGAAMRAYRPELRSKSGTMKEGMSPVDLMWCTKISSLCQQKNIIMIGIVNDELVPFADKLDGVVKGIIAVSSPYSATIQDRASGRAPVMYAADKADVSAAAAWMRYPAAASDSTGFGRQSS